MSLLARSLFQSRSGTQVFSRGLKRKSKISVTLLKAVPKLGAEGATVQVSRALMRHELFPRRLADYVPKYTGPLDRAKAVKEEQAAKAAASNDSADTQRKVHNLALKNQGIISQLLNVESLVFERNTMPKEGSSEESVQTIYGSLTKADVVKALAEKHGITVEKEALNMDDKIKHTGEYTCTIKLIYAGQTSLKLRVVSSDS
ncbi:hypothetical protein H4R22_000249 [Coemansia sp. RSA 1290]|nr:hypothetical protein BX667DRAFT_514372 [Coemansia mojavensis]KAJ1744121.1 hypothetical protein LPJ68_000351 [Coemansia sp. RSA 1086]KAJ1752675.1 hypothetical protein LPJ79_001061 [Coemansia sp. RSA 1821]KAJ1874710.1 hypothetical protein LPJ55_001317 [Coemansia sp. RSA 990]KAJ2633709.1 hypothetical protein H4R22_000249 [Coemansia sp. RSA 1290]KAJ2651337.1 hypothetical protein IWW40_001828 [Coemansia sp. RSA 1250]KAJ2673683.1 hypothetical protein IWW42_002095 [Coemansia sp. RSA 1085]